jgi:hypothetical protein
VVGGSIDESEASSEDGSRSEGSVEDWRESLRLGVSCEGIRNTSCMVGSRGDASAAITGSSGSRGLNEGQAQCSHIEI